MDAQQAAQQMQQAQRRLQQLDRNLAQLESSMQEIHTAISTLEGLTGDAAMNTRIPVGAGVRVAAQVDPTQQVVVDLGSGYSTEMTATDAVAKLRDRLRSTESAFQATSTEADTTAQVLQELQMQSMVPPSS